MVLKCLHIQDDIMLRYVTILWLIVPNCSHTLNDITLRYVTSSFPHLVSFPENYDNYLVPIVHGWGQPPK